MKKCKCNHEKSVMKKAHAAIEKFHGKGSMKGERPKVNYKGRPF